MKIFIDRPYPKKHIIIKRMEPYWNEWGHKVTWDFSEADIQLCFSHREYKTNLPMVLRMDGIYYHNNKKNKVLSKAHSMADAVIYQSYFCKQAAEKFLKPTKKDIPKKVIYNGIEPIPDIVIEKKEKKDQINIFTCSVWRRWKRLREITKIFKISRSIDKSLPIFLHVIGNTRNFKKPEDSNIIFYEELDFNEIKGYYLQGDIFIHISKNDWCPNSVVEALGFGMPVIASSASGGTVEILKLGKDLGEFINEGSADLTKDPYSEEWNRMTLKQMEEGANVLLKLCKKPRKIKLPKELHIENVAREYINLMQQLAT